LRLVENAQMQGPEIPRNEAYIGVPCNDEG
jgi:hypothetical protein